VTYTQYSGMIIAAMSLSPIPKFLISSSRDPISHDSFGLSLFGSRKYAVRASMMRSLAVYIFFAMKRGYPKWSCQLSSSKI